MTGERKFGNAQLDRALQFVAAWGRVLQVPRIAMVNRPGKMDCG